MNGKETLKELWIGLGAWVVLTVAAGFPLSGFHPGMISGALMGGLLSAGLLYHMYQHLDIALDLDVENAEKHIRNASLWRSLIRGVAVLVSFYFHRYLHPAGVIAGLFGIKIAAYLQPFIHRLFIKDKENS